MSLTPTITLYKFLQLHIVSPASSPGVGLARPNREREESWEGCKTRCSAPIPQRHAHHHIIRRDAWGRGTLYCFVFAISTLLMVFVNILRKIETGQFQMSPLSFHSAVLENSKLETPSGCS